MDRRTFVATGVGGAIAAGTPVPAAGVPSRPSSRAPASPSGAQAPVRELFPRLQHDVFINAAGGTPLGTFSEAGLERYMDFQRLGGGDGRRDYVVEMQTNIRRLFAELIGARESEIALVHCTKEGEQIVIDGLDALHDGGNLVTNDFHFSGSLHNLIGLRDAGLDVRIVRNRDWDVSVDAMTESMDDRTALVSVTLVSNMTGRLEPMRELADEAHQRGAYVYADIIQTAGITPMDVNAMGIDFAACSAYKWLFGVHGVGFLYVREELQGTALRDRLYPGHVRHNYAPWTPTPAAGQGDFIFNTSPGPRRYEPGHVCYLAYCAAYEGLKFIREQGVENMSRHAVGLARRLKNALDPELFRCISPEPLASPLISFVASRPEALEASLRAANIVVTLDGNRVRVSPAIYNTEDDMDLLAEALNTA